MSPYCLVLLGVLAVNAEASAPSAPPLVPIPEGVFVPARSTSADSIHWPEDLQPLATLEGPAILAANAALLEVLSRFPKETAGSCESSARSLDVVVGQQGGLYFVRIDRRADRCGWAPGVQLEFDWFELYAVTAEGRILARHPALP